jgi:hypothetical protein
MPEINVERGYGMIICLEKSCKFNRECANHETAGDFRSEDGFTPSLSLQLGKVYCNTKNTPPDPSWEFGFTPLKINHNSQNGAVLWKDLHETINNYNI